MKFLTLVFLAIISIGTSLIAYVEVKTYQANSEQYVAEVAQEEAVPAVTQAPAVHYCQNEGYGTFFKIEKRYFGDLLFMVSNPALGYRLVAPKDTVPENCEYLQAIVLADGATGYSAVDGEVD